MSYETVIPEKGIYFTWCDDMSLKELLSKKEEIMSEPFEGDNSGKTVAKLAEVLANVVL